MLVVPAIWMKPDKAGMYNFLLQWKISIDNYTNTETNNLFHELELPTSIFLIRKILNNQLMYHNIFSLSTQKKPINISNIL